MELLYVILICCVAVALSCVIGDRLDSRRRKFPKELHQMEEVLWQIERLCDGYRWMYERELLTEEEANERIEKLTELDGISLEDTGRIRVMTDSKRVGAE